MTTKDDHYCVCRTPEDLDALIRGFWWVSKKEITTMSHVGQYIVSYADPVFLPLPPENRTEVSISHYIDLHFDRIVQWRLVDMARSRGGDLSSWPILYINDSWILSFRPIPGDIYGRFRVNLNGLPVAIDKMRDIFTLCALIKGVPDNSLANVTAVKP